VSVDRWIGGFDRALRAVFGVSRALRPHPVPPAEAACVPLQPDERRCAAALMRVNHAGEVCAQALYQAQKIMGQSASARRLFEEAAYEEQDHLAWTAARLNALDGHVSRLNLFWYAGAFVIGLAAGRMGERTSLGFMAETERQVEQHLKTHLERLPKNDVISRAVIQQMCVDEVAHGEAALQAGGMALPLAVRTLMRVAARVMTETAYYL